ncbi:MAG: GlsB/YeaQ/YmgE family stress response membrane protein [Devosia sp.]
MELTTQSILVILVVGLVAGWLAGQIVRGGGMGIVADLAVGIVGAFIGSWVLPKMGIVLGAGLLAAIINATIGAIILLLIIRLIQGRGRFRR